MSNIIPLAKKVRPPKFKPYKIENNVFADTRLSWAAKGIYAYVIASGVRVDVDVLKAMAQGDYSIGRAINELLRAGYINVIGDK